MHLQWFRWLLSHFLCTCTRWKRWEISIFGVSSFVHMENRWYRRYTQCTERSKIFLHQFHINIKNVIFLPNESKTKTAREIWWKMEHFVRRFQHKCNTKKRMHKLTIDFAIAGARESVWEYGPLWPSCEKTIWRADWKQKKKIFSVHYSFTCGCAQLHMR